MHINIELKLTNLTTKSGVYQMLDKDDNIIYIGKAKNLKRRVSSYFNAGKQNSKTIKMINKVVNFEIIVVETEVKALLLENELIKKHQPKYNILLKDSKTYPYISISNDTHPKIGLYRGVKNNKNHYFGPFPSVGVVRESLAFLKKIFKLRECANSVYKSRSRPCLEHQIGLCSAPCVAKITTENYQKDVQNAKSFLLGNSKQILQEIEEKMTIFAKNQDFELAAHYRDQMISLRKIQEKHNSNTSFDIDFIHIEQEKSISCVQIIFVRDGKQIDNEVVFPKNTNEMTKIEVLEAFLPLYYQTNLAPKNIVLSENLDNYQILEQALKTKIALRLNDDKKHFLTIASLTAIENLKHYLLRRNRETKQLSHLKDVLNMDKPPKHIECFDISHHSGEATIASCVVFKDGKPSKKDYRLFNITGITGGDDYAAMRCAIYRRYKNEKDIPDLLLIDGGLGQLNQAIMVFDSIGIENCLLVGVAKGEGRKAGLETLVIKIADVVQKINLKPDDIALNLVNFVRDEAHRFAITNHRKKFKKKRNRSILEDIDGIGKNKRLALLNYFGNIDDIKNASINELTKVNGINLKIATKIVDFWSV